MYQRPKAKAKPKPPNRNRLMISRLGYLNWVEYVSTFTNYSQIDSGVESVEVHGTSLWAPGTYLAQHADNQLDAESPSYLFVLDVDDLLSFTEDDIRTAWELRIQTCGSIVATAELYALYRVINGDDDLYAGSSAYLEHPEVLAIFDGRADEASLGAKAAIQIEVSLSDPVQKSLDAAEPETADGLNLEQVQSLSSAELQVAWANRPESFASLEAAAEALATLRALNSTDPEKSNFRRMMGHQLIQELEDALPLELKPGPGPSTTIELELLNVDRRTVRTQVTVVRPGQGNFRTTMLERYGAECCITGCKVDSLLEAAHILPYRGDQSDDPLNGLLLRVDIHRLFDAHLISINPKTLTVEVACTLGDDGYQSFHGKRLFTFSPKPRVLFLEAHFQDFKSKFKSRNWGST